MEQFSATPVFQDQPQDGLVRGDDIHGACVPLPRFRSEKQDIVTGYELAPALDYRSDVAVMTGPGHLLQRQLCAPTMVPIHDIRTDFLCKEWLELVAH
jgi:hypothetical protein